MRRRAGRFGLDIVMVNIWESVADPGYEARWFSELHGVEGPVLLDTTGELAARLGIRGVPTNVVVDADATVRDVGATTPTQLERAITRLLGHDRWRGE